ncbi:adenine phosphoribosyltransferase [Pelosinus propionicus]|uniref:Adenine phosphoribosyltransferase n=1 Tax=Pelosinus propionicus DSM 13327 TaxID=1123291 RepID=A0A1I4KSL6_9FIRM|nr:adenine phosphoribosyltransferase [Pelosinus propionicus]SFL81784.1 adenine phosphoribosyltransferase [Pelosinus propionicus DSM 13327]
MDFKENIRVVTDFPEKGIRFKDITTLLKDGICFHQAIDALAEPFQGQGIELVVGPEARGFVIGAPVAYALKAGFVPVRKPGKLPAETLKHEYNLEYGKDSLEIHKDAIIPGQKVLIVDDLLATGGTVQATISMVEALGGVVVGLVFLIELSYLEGRKNLKNYNITSLLKY